MEPQFYAVYRKSGILVSITHDAHDPTPQCPHTNGPLTHHISTLYIGTPFGEIIALAIPKYATNDYLHKKWSGKRFAILKECIHVQQLITTGLFYNYQAIFTHSHMELVSPVRFCRSFLVNTLPNVEQRCSNVSTISNNCRTVLGPRLFHSDLAFITAASSGPSDGGLLGGGRGRGRGGGELCKLMVNSEDRGVHHGCSWI